MNKQDEQTLSFVACPNHSTNEVFDKLYPIGQGRFRCSLCGKDFTAEELRKELQQDYAYKLQDLQMWYQQSMAKLFADHQKELDVIKATAEEGEE